MATIQAVDQVGEHGTPVVDRALPPPGAYPSAAGEGLSDLAVKTTSTYIEARKSLAREEAQRAATSFLEEAVKIRGEYGALRFNDAVEQHGAFVQRLDAVRSELRSALGSRFAVDHYEAESTYTLRRELEIMENHVTAERKALGDMTYRNTLKAGAEDLSSLAQQVGHGRAGWDALSGRMDTLIQAAQDRAKSLGFKGGDADEFVQASLSAPVTSLAKSLHGSPLLGTVIEKYGKYLTGSEADSFKSAYKAQRAEADAAALLKTIPRIDGTGERSPLGRLDAGAVRRALAAAEKDGPRPDLRAAVKHAQDIDDAEAAKQVKQLYAKVIDRGFGTGPGGTFAVPTSSPEWQQYRKLDPPGALKMMEDAKNRQYRATRQEQAVEAFKAQADLGKLYQMIEEAPNNGADISREDLIEGLGVAGLKYLPRAQAFLSKTQKGDGDAVMSKAVVTKLLTGTLGKSAADPEKFAAAYAYSKELLADEKKRFNDPKAFQSAMAQWARAHGNFLQRAFADEPPTPSPRRTSAQPKRAAPPGTPPSGAVMIDLSKE